MKEIKLYRCEICGTQYNEKRKAQECEKSHLPYVTTYESRYKANNEYPETITVKFSNNQKVIYYRGKKI